MNLIDLPKDLLENCLVFVSFKDMRNILLINKYFWINFYDNYVNKKKKRYLKRKLPVHIFDLIKDYNFGKIKFLNFKENFINIDYIDSVSIDDVDSSIMYSKDNFERPFLTFLLDVKDEFNNQFNVVHTLFQRYSDNKNLWVFGTMYPNCNMHIQAIPENNILENYKKVISKEMLTLDNYQIKLG